jgi:hypothetical protein
VGRGKGRHVWDWIGDCMRGGPWLWKIYGTQRLNFIWEGWLFGRIISLFNLFQDISLATSESGEYIPAG